MTGKGSNGAERRSGDGQVLRGRQAAVRGAVHSGADRLAAGLSHPLLDGQRIGLVTNPTGITADFRSTVEVCRGLASSRLTALFACEHGIYGQHQAGVRFGDEFDAVLGIPVYSLYGEQKTPVSYMLEGLDTIVFDVQDLGVRFYTYLSTLLYVMEACAEHGISLLVLDRPSPLGGTGCEGGLLQEGYESMVGAWTMPIRTGITIGEFARMANDRKGLHCDLDVIPLAGWRREMEFTDTGLPWMLPSPNMPTIETVRVYGGTCFFEGTNLSEGRGMTIPFQWIGAPWLDGACLADAMRKHELPGVHFHPLHATPAFSKHQGELCGGVRLFVTDPQRYEAVHTGLTLLHEVSTLYPEHFEWLTPPEGRARYFIDLLTGGEKVRRSIGTVEGLQAIAEEWRRDSAKWLVMRQPYLLYS
ncbi:exo-beta-N-acetylmuramidase NamZ family protein [Paenibacillus sp. 22594]|uniref:exo-beta-N-acetylmuramidase NamZ family protein n=1 Tax=Paenibacillus sp. 22594 TaxID=3453947 RepID=UPI003F86302B